MAFLHVSLIGIAQIALLTAREQRYIRGLVLHCNKF
jgi:hypothetical protein